MRVWITRDNCGYHLHVVEPDWDKYWDYWLGGQFIGNRQALNLLGQHLKINGKKRITIGRIK